MKKDALEVFLTEVFCGSKHKENGESGVQSKMCQWVEIMLIRSAVAIHHSSQIVQSWIRKNY